MSARLLFLLIPFCAWLASGPLALAQEPSAEAKLSHRASEVGATVQLQIQVENASGTFQPPGIQVDGLEINYAGASPIRQVEIIHGATRVRNTVILLYQIIPKRAGDFTIPPQEMEIGGRRVRTAEVALKVGKAEGAAADNELKAWAEIEVKKKSAYIGEIVPVEVRLLIDRRIRIEDITSAPELTGDGFTMQKFPRYTQENERRDGREYEVIVFRAALTPTKAGKLTIGPCDMPFDGQITRRNRQRSLLGSFLGDDFFDPFNAQRKHFEIKAPAVELEVKPLPADGRPKSFAGAVGRFQMEAQGSPAQVKLGDPVTMQVQVFGEGNFDRVQAPILADPQGWRAYDASETFKPGNEMKTSGTKLFEVPVIPEAKHSRMPVMEFSYFDPETAQYVTLQSKPGALTVLGEPVVAAATPAPAAAAGTETAPAERDATDIVGLQYEAGPRATFTPWHRTPVFWAAHGLATAALLGFVLRRAFRREPAQKRVVALRRERAALWQRMERNEDEFYEQAARWVQLTAALAGPVEPASVDAPVACRVLRADAETGAAIDEIFAARAERLYAGVGGGGTVAAADRQRLLGVLVKLSGR